MLTALSVRDIVLIERLDLDLASGLTVLTGETGAGKSILLDALGLVLGARGDSALVRTGQKQGVVSAALSLDVGHPVLTILEEQGVDCSDGLVLRRIQRAEGSSRAFVNDQPVSVTLLKRIGVQLAEIHGQHDDRALIDPENHRRLVDAFGELDSQAQALGELWRAWQSAAKALQAREAALAEAEAERQFVTHAVEELTGFEARVGEEALLAARRQMMMNAEQFSEAIGEARAALTGDGSLDAGLNAALRKLERRRAEADGHLDELCAALDRLTVEMAESYQAIVRAEDAFTFDASELEQTEERLFTLRALARKYKVEADDLPALLERHEQTLRSLDDGGRSLDAERRKVGEARDAYFEAARALSAARAAAAARLDTRVMAELAPLKLERAVFTTLVEADEERPGADGLDHVEFLVSANPGVPPAPIRKAASGGELSRIMLALKVTLADKASAPTLVFDEIDTGVGGAVADAIGQRLERLAQDLQVIAVTHSPQVAARAAHHMLISKMEEVGDGADVRVVTRVSELQAASRREEIARMLSAAEVTHEARAQADRLLERAG